MTNTTQPASIPPPTHDVGITQVKVSPTHIIRGETVTITVFVLNEGTFDETMNVAVFYDTVQIANWTVQLAKGQNQNQSLDWYTSGVAAGTYLISAKVTPVRDEIHLTDNTFTYGQVIVTEPASTPVTPEMILIATITVVTVVTLLRRMRETGTLPNCSGFKTLEGEGIMFHSVS